MKGVAEPQRSSVDAVGLLEELSSPCSVHGHDLLGGEYYSIEGTQRNDIEAPLVSSSKPAGLQGLRPHDLTPRRAGARGGANVEAVQERLGHASIAVTADIDGKVVPGKDRDAAGAPPGGMAERTNAAVLKTDDGRTSVSRLIPVCHIVSDWNTFTISTHPRP